MELLFYLQTVLHYSSDNIKFFINNNDIIEISGKYVICDETLLVRIMRTMYVFDANLDKTLKKISNDNYEDYLLIFEYISNGNFRLALDLLNKINDNGYYPNLLRKAIENVPDKMSYMYNVKYSNESLKEFYHSIERDALIELDRGSFKKFAQKIALLKDVPEYEIYIDVISSFLNELNYLNTNKKFIGNRSDIYYMGNPLIIIKDLLDGKDYFRVNEVIISNITDEDFNNTFYHIIFILNSYLQKILKRNININYQRIKSDVREINNINNLVGLDSKQLDSIDEYSKKKKLNIKGSYQKYLEYFNNKEYKKARDEIYALSISLDTKSLNYLIKELDVLIYNSSNNKSNLIIWNKLIDKANELYNKHEYIDAIKYYEESINYDLKTNPSTLAKIGLCYYNEEDYKKAINYLEEADKSYLNPRLYFELSLAHYYIGNYKKSIEYGNMYQDYYGDTSPELHYLLSICYAELSDYQEALNEVSLSEISNVMTYDHEETMVSEKNKLIELSNGNDINLYNIDDFCKYIPLPDNKTVDLLSYDDKDSLYNNILTMVNTFSSSNNEKIQYLLLFSKKLKEIKERDILNKVLNKVEETLNESDIDPIDYENYRLLLKNYRKL